VNIALRWNAAGAKLAILVNPHAPSGRLTSVEELAAVARAFDGVLLIDEAYIDFVDPGIRHNSSALVSDLDNVLLLRTMNKGYSLAGLRLGYGIGPPHLIAPMLSKTKDSYNVDVVSQKVGEAALHHQAEAATSWVIVRAERIRLAGTLSERIRLCAFPGELPACNGDPTELGKGGAAVEWTGDRGDLRQMVRSETASRQPSHLNWHGGRE